MKRRSSHSAPVAGECLYVWAGNQSGRPSVHESAQKREYSSSLNIFNLTTGYWSTQSTTGPPPLGILEYSTVTSNHLIYYFGGWCGHDDCYHNSVHSLNTLTFHWTQLHATSDQLMRRRAAGLIDLELLDGLEHLVAIGGVGSDPITYQSQAEYIQSPNGYVCTNEQMIFNLNTGQWTVPTISGQCCPPTHGFVIEKISNTKAVMFGGRIGSDDAIEYTNSVYIITAVSQTTTLHWESIKSSLPTDLWPHGRSAHASTIIIGQSLSPILVTIGGLDQQGYEPVKDNCCWLMNIEQYQWTKLALPESVTSRYLHSLSAIMIGPTSVWLTIVGGVVKSEEKYVEGVLEWSDTYISDLNHNTVVIELVLTDSGWSVGTVLYSNDLGTVDYQKKFQSLLQSRNWWKYQLIEQPQQRIAELQKYCQSLLNQLQVTQENRVSLQEALLEANEQVEQLQEYSAHQTQQLTIRLENYEKLKAEIGGKEKLISKLTRVKPKALTDSKCVQCDYWTKTELLFDGLVTVGKKVCLFRTARKNEMLLEECHLKLSLPEGLVSPITSAVYEVAAQGLWAEEFVFPEGTRLISGVCFVCVSPAELAKPVTVQLKHCADIQHKSQCKYLSFVVAESRQAPFKFQLLAGGSFSTDTKYGSIQLKKFSLLAIVLNVTAGVASAAIAGPVAGIATGLAVRGAVLAAQGAVAPQVGQSDDNTADSNDSVTAPATKEAIVPPPDCHFRAVLFHKNLPPEKLEVSLAVLLDHDYFVKRFETSTRDLGAEKLSFRFKFSHSLTEGIRRDGVLTLSNFTEANKTIHGWTVTPLIRPTEITETDVHNYNRGDIAQLPHVKVSVIAHLTDAGFKDKLQHELVIKGTEVTSLESCRKIIIDTSLNEISYNQQYQLPLDPQVAVESLRNHFADISDLMSIGSNRSAIVPLLYSKSLIPWDIYNEAVDSSGRTDQQKSNAVMRALMSTVKSQPAELLPLLIDVLKRVDAFTNIADRLNRDLYQ